MITPQLRPSDGTMLSPMIDADPGLDVAYAMRPVAANVHAEAALQREGIILPLPQRTEWLQASGCSHSALIVARDATNRCTAAAGIGARPSRAIPGLRAYRVERLSASRSEYADGSLLSQITQLARHDKRCLRVNIELFERDRGARQRMGNILAELGYSLGLQRSYAHTLALDLSPGESALFAAFKPTVRKGVREPAKRGLVIRPVTEPWLAPRLQTVLVETIHRTGGGPVSQVPWDMIIHLSATRPAQSRIAGLFDPHVEGPESLVSFAWGAWHGTYVTFEIGASVRRPDLGRTSVTYAPMWDLIAWATTTGAEWFDFGGVTDGGTDTTNDAFKGISEFKRFFCQNTVDVGEEWVLEPSAFRASVARTVSALARRLGR